MKIHTLKKINGIERDPRELKESQSKRRCRNQSKVGFYPRSLCTCAKFPFWQITRKGGPLGFAFSSFRPPQNCTLLNGSIYTIWTISWSRDCTFNFTRWTLWLLTNASSLVQVVGEKVALGILLTKTLTLFRTFYEFKRWPDEICRVYVNCTWPIISGIIKADWTTSINFFILSIFTIFVTITNPWFPNTFSSTFVARKFRFIDTWTCRTIFGLLQSVVVVTRFRI